MQQIAVAFQSFLSCGGLGYHVKVMMRPLTVLILSQNVKCQEYARGFMQDVIRRWWERVQWTPYFTVVTSVIHHLHHLCKASELLHKILLLGLALQMEVMKFII